MENKLFIFLTVALQFKAAERTDKKVRVTITIRAENARQRAINRMRPSAQQYLKT
jgi:hypothetical protein